MADKHFRAYSAVFPVVFRHNEGGGKQILLHRRQNTGYMDGRWDIAASGHVDDGETATAAAVRECKEEIGLIVSVDDLTFCHLSHRFTNRVYYDIYFLVGAYSGTPTIMEPDKCSELDWFSVDALPDDMIPCRRAAVSDILNGVMYSERMEE